MYSVAETFLSINGEGLEAGVMAQFIRLAGCPLSCSYCDTAWARTGASGKDMSLETIIELLKASPAKWLTLTGGEPMAAAGITELLEAILRETDMCVEVETSGAVDLSPFLVHFKAEPRLRFTVDYKLDSSNMHGRMAEAHYSQLRSNDVIKYVVGSEKDLFQAIAHVGSLNIGSGAVEGPTPIFSPVFGQIEAKRMVEAILVEKLNRVKVQLQLHKYIWEPNQQGV